MDGELGIFPSPRSFIEAESYIRQLAPRFALLSYRSNTGGEARNFPKSHSLYGRRARNFSSRELEIFSSPRGIYIGGNICTTAYMEGELGIFPSPRVFIKSETYIIWRRTPLGLRATYFHVFLHISHTCLHIFDTYLHISLIFLHIQHILTWNMSFLSPNLPPPFGLAHR